MGLQSNGQSSSHKTSFEIELGPLDFNRILHLLLNNFHFLAYNHTISSSNHDSCQPPASTKLKIKKKAMFFPALKAL